MACHVLIMLRSYGMQVPFAMSSLRDERLRAFYGCAHHAVPASQQG